MNRAILRLVRLQRHPLIGRAARAALVWHGTDIGRRAILGHNLRLLHGGIGVVIHGRTYIGDDVTLFHGVTIGRQDFGAAGFAGVVICSGVTLCAGATVLGRAGMPPLVVGRGTVVGANSVLLCSTGENEVWAGVPARRLTLPPERE